MSLALPQTLAGRYEVTNQIGEGGFALVYRGTDTRLRRPVAVKVLKEQHSQNQGFVARFEREAHAAAKVRHPNVVQVLDSGREDGKLFIIMELVEGGNLKELIYGRESAFFVVNEALAITEDILAGLGAVHDSGIVHRDVKPNNVLLDDHGRAKIGDFGIAKAPGDSVTTRGAQPVGTAAYLAPERITQQNVAPAADLYAVGIILFELLTTRLPFLGPDFLDFYGQHIHAQPPRPSEWNPGIPASLDHIVLRALAKNPDDRFSSAAGFAAALSEVRALADQRTGGAAPRDDAAIKLPKDMPQGQSQSSPSDPTAPMAKEFHGRSEGRFGSQRMINLVFGLAILALAVWLVRSLLIPPSTVGTPAAVTPTQAASAPNLAATSSPAATPQIPAVAPTVAIATVATAVPTTPPTLTVQPTTTSTPTQAEIWNVTLRELDSAWGKDWVRTIALIDSYLARFPDHGPAREKLYAALVAYGKELLRQGRVEEGTAQLVRAQSVQSGGEATAALLALTPTAVPTARPPAAPVQPLATPRPQPSEPKLRVGEKITVDQTIKSPFTQYYFITLESVEINAQGVVRANFLFECRANVGPCVREKGQNRTTAWLEDVSGRRYPMIEGSGSPLESPGPQGQTNTSYGGFLIFPGPDPQKMPVAIIYGGGNTFRGLQLSR